MFGRNFFEPSSSSPFGPQLVFGQNNNASSNPFAPRPFGSTSPFGSQTGGSDFGGMSTGVSGAQSSSLLGSMSVSGSSSSPAFGSSTPTFGASSGSTFGNSSSAFGGSLVFGQEPTFGGFGSSTTQISPFGSSFQQTQPAFGSNVFGSFGAPTPFGSSSSPAFGASSTPAFGGTNSPASGSPANPAFGSTSGSFGGSSCPFGSSAPAFGAPSTPAFGALSTPSFGATSTPAFCILLPNARITFAFGASPTPAFGSSPFTTTSTFGAQTASFGAQTTTPAFGFAQFAFGGQRVGFGQFAFGRQRGGSRGSPYSATPERDTGTQPAGLLESISAMPVYKDKSHEELRWEDYKLGDRGGPYPAGQTNAIGFGQSAANPFSSSLTSPAFGQSAANPFSSSTTSNPFAPEPQGFSSPAFVSSSTSAFGTSPFGTTSNTPTLLGSTSSGTSSLFGPTTQAFGGNTSPSPFSSSSTSPFGPPSIFGPTSAQGTASTVGTDLGFSNTQSSPLFQSTTPTLAQTSSPSGQTSSTFGQSAPAVVQWNANSTPSTGFGGNLFSSPSSLQNSFNTLGFAQTTPSHTTPVQSTQPTPSSGGFNFSNLGQPQTGAASGFGGTPGMISITPSGQLCVTFPFLNISS